MPDKTKAPLPTDTEGDAKTSSNGDDTPFVSKKSSSKKGGRRTRNFASVVYPDSAPPDWVEKLDALHVPAFISPLHDKDTNPDGTPKKSHWHVLLMFDGVKTPEQVKAEVWDVIGAVGQERVNSARGYARYLCHMDNPEKAQYSMKDVTALGGADYDSVTHLPSDDLAVIGEMCDFCDSHRIYSFKHLARYAKVWKPDWAVSLTRSTTYFMVNYLQSSVWTAKNLTTGEIERVNYLIEHGEEMPPELVKSPVWRMQED